MVIRNPCASIHPHIFFSGAYKSEAIDSQMFFSQRIVKRHLAFTMDIEIASRTTYRHECMGSDLESWNYPLLREQGTPSFWKTSIPRTVSLHP